MHTKQYRCYSKLSRVKYENHIELITYSTLNTKENIPSEEYKMGV